MVAVQLALEPAARADPLTTPEWKGPPRPFELHWELLRLPERIVAMAALPLYPLITLVEEHRLDLRLYELLTNDERTLIVFPIIDVRGSEGVQGGLRLTHSNFLGRGEVLDLSGWIKANLDFAMAARLGVPLPSYPGRALFASARYELDRDRGYFPIGGDSLREDGRALRSESAQLVVGASWRDPAHEWLGLGLEVSLFREGIQDERAQKVDAARFPGAGRVLTFPEVRLVLVADRRDRPGRPASGWLASAELSGTQDLEGAQLSAIRGEVSFSWLVRLLPRDRVLGLSVGGAAAVPWRSDQQVPLHAHPTLGRDRHLRGYVDRRFVDRYAWWASAEYRWPIKEAIDSDLSLSALLFVDVARAGGGVEQLFARPPRWSIGVGLLGDTALRGLLRLLVGFSPEGVELTLSFGGLP